MSLAMRANGKEDDCASGGDERVERKKESKREEWKISLSSNCHAATEKFSTLSRVTEDSVAKREDIRRLPCL